MKWRVKKEYFKKNAKLRGGNDLYASRIQCTRLWSNKFLGLHRLLLHFLSAKFIRPVRGCVTYGPTETIPHVRQATTIFACFSRAATFYHIVGVHRTSLRKSPACTHQKLMQKDLDQCRSHYVVAHSLRRDHELLAPP